MKRSQRRSPNLTSWDRLLLGFYTLLVSPKRLRRIAVIPKASTLVRLHQALTKRKYHLLLYNSRRPRRILIQNYRPDQAVMAPPGSRLSVSRNGSTISRSGCRITPP